MISNGEITLEKKHRKVFDKNDGAEIISGTGYNEDGTPVKRNILNQLRLRVFSINISKIMLPTLRVKIRYGYFWQGGSTDGCRKRLIAKIKIMKEQDPIRNGCGGHRLNQRGNRISGTIICFKI